MRFCILFLCGFAFCRSLGAQDDKSWKHPEPIAYESLRKWHEEGGLSSYFWPKEHQIDLNEDGRNEVFLGVEGYGRGMFYALFTQRKGRWIMLSSSIGGSHHDFDVLAAKHHGWHDFKALSPSGRGGLIEVVYTWKGRTYVRKSDRKITADELFGRS